MNASTLELMILNTIKSVINLNLFFPFDLISHNNWSRQMYMYYESQTLEITKNNRTFL